MNDDMSEIEVEIIGDGVVVSSDDHETISVEYEPPAGPQ
jgi:hypothetical protein